MKLYHGSNVCNIKILEPKQADHDRPYIYLSSIDVVAAFYMCNAVEKPYYWFPYGFTKENIPIYHELYPNALKEVSEHRKGCLYEVEAGEDQVIPFKNIPCARLGVEPMAVVNCVEIPDAYAYFMQCAEEGRLEIGRFEDKTEQQLQNWYGMIYNYIQEKNMIKTPDCSYACYIKEKFPQIWEEYEKNSKLLF